MIEENKNAHEGEDHEEMDYSNKTDIFMAILPALLLLFITIEIIAVETQY